MSEPTPENIQAVYDFENVIAEAFAVAFRTKGIEAYTPASPAKFQQKRPRVEFIFKVGNGLQRTEMTTGQQRESCWNGTLAATLLTNVSTEGKQAHAAFRAMFRHTMENIHTDVNGTQLTYHKVEKPVPGETGLVFKHSEGFEHSQFLYTMQFSIHPNAWAVIVPPTT